MSAAAPPTETAAGHPDAAGAVLATMTDLQERVRKLEDDGRTTLLKRLTMSATTSALFLGLILTFASLYDVFVAKPEADRISRISQFNQAVNAAAKTRQELIQTQLQTTDANLQLTVAQLATPRILNDIATARAMLREMTDDDVGVPQLIVLISEAFTAGDLESAKEFTERAVGKKNVSAYLRSEALRFQGKYLFAAGRPQDGLKSFEEALAIMREANPAARGFILADLGTMALMSRQCTAAADALKRFALLLADPLMFADARRQLSATVRTQIAQWPRDTCPFPDEVSALLQ
jgi:tetratricopeptide (TPR) repeat protein